MNAWICQLRCGRWIVVGSEMESQADYYINRQEFRALDNACFAAFSRNFKQGWGYTVFPSGGIPPYVAKAFNL